MSGVDFGNYKRIVQAFWDPEPKNDDPTGAPIWCLGVEHSTKKLSNGVNHDDSKQSEVTAGQVNGTNGTHPPEETESWEDLGKQKNNAQRENGQPDQTWPPELLDDCEARMWFTYRSSFPPIKKSPDASTTLSVRLRSLADQSGFTSDTGWGCMIRSGQSLLANALSILRLGREWRRGQKASEERQLLALFADDPKSPFSLHRFVEHGASACGKHPGEWFGPSATARCIQALSQDYSAASLRVYVNGDGADVYQDRFFNLAKPDPTQSFTPTLILVQIRLGIDRITPVYWDSLKRTLQLPQSVGIAGGRPSSSHYFFATQGDNFFYLDPHFTRPALPLHSNPEAEGEYTQEEVDSCHTRRLRRIGLKDMDPSMLIAFLIRSEDDWRDWRQAVSKTSPGTGGGSSSDSSGSAGKAVVHVADTEPSLHGGLGGSGAGAGGGAVERSSAVDDVETIDDDEMVNGDDNSTPHGDEEEERRQRRRREEEGNDHDHDHDDGEGDGTLVEKDESHL